MFVNIGKCTIRIFVVYIDTGSSVPGVLSKSRDLADENKNNELNIVNQFADLHFLLFVNITGN
jgi:hypothetical protein